MHHGLWSSFVADPRGSQLMGAVVAGFAIAACTLVIYPIKAAAPVDSLGVVYILPVLVVAANWGARLGVATAPALRVRAAAQRGRVAPPRRGRGR